MALVGPSPRPLQWPPGAPSTEALLRVLREYMQQALTDIISQTQGVVGLRGLSSTGTPALTLRTINLDAGNQLRTTWSFSAIEADASLGFWLQLSTTTGIELRSASMTVTGLTMEFTATTPSGLLANIMVLR